MVGLLVPTIGASDGVTEGSLDGAGTSQQIHFFCLNYVRKVLYFKVWWFGCFGQLQWIKETEVENLNNIIQVKFPKEHDKNLWKCVSKVKNNTVSDNQKQFCINWRMLQLLWTEVPDFLPEYNKIVKMYVWK